MSETWFRVCRRWRAEIETIAVERSTEHSAFIRDPFNSGTPREKAKPTRMAIRSEWANHFRSWDEAHAFLMEAAESEVKSLRARLETAKGHLGNVRGMRKKETA